ncbi:DNA binding protein [Fragilaria crotonensis]|nr:DNA binding protein [Fragilaria crotonensis]
MADSPNPCHSECGVVRPWPATARKKAMGETGISKNNSQRSSANAPAHSLTMQATSCLTIETTQPPPNPIELDLILIGFGLEVGPNVGDATDASVRAVQDALYGGRVSTGNLRSDTRPWQATLKLGVPRQRLSTSTPMHVDLGRVASLFPRQASILSIGVEVGGLWAAGNDVCTGNNAACAVVAYVVVQRPASPPETRRPERAALRHTMTLQNQPRSCLPGPLGPPNPLWRPQDMDDSSMQMFARISVEKGNREGGKQRSSSNVPCRVIDADSSTSENAKEQLPGFKASNNGSDVEHRGCIDLAREKPTRAAGTVVTGGGNYNFAFPTKLHLVLSQVEKDGYGHIISWQPHGISFKIHDKSDFAEIVLPRYYKHLKQESFFGQLRVYGFTRLSSGPDRGAFFHEKFLRDMRFLCRHMSRTKIKGKAIRSAGEPSSKPTSDDSPHESMATATPNPTNDGDPVENSSSVRIPRLTTTGEHDANNNPKTFPMKLHRLLDKLEAANKRDIISWLPHGQGFVVRNPDALVREILPKYFRQTKYASFQRQLSTYGFQRLKEGPERGAMHHEHFQRGKQLMCRLIVRMEAK